MAATALTTSCFKDEPLNAEADILHISVQVDDPLKTFFNISDTAMDVPYAGAGDSIIFTIKHGADVSAMAPKFVITEGATVEPASGTIRDFSHGKLPYTVTSQDGQWKRTYLVGFSEDNSREYFSLDNATMYKDNLGNGRFYQWGDGLCTANMGFMVARSSATAEEYPTIYDPNGYQGGCAQLRTVSTGAWGLMTHKRIAAGNLFLGTFDMTYALTQTLKATCFGRPVQKKPLTFSGYYKYKAGAQMQDANGNNIEGTDSCAIYAVVFKNHDAEGKEVVLNGEDIMTNPNRVGMAKFYDIPQTSEWTPFCIEFKYWEELDPELLKNRGYSMVFVCSASKDGDLFQGAEGSTLWVDELMITSEEE